MTTGKRITLLTNDFHLSAATVAKLYPARWQVQLFFKWIKQHPRIKAFYGTSVNAVKTQIWIAISVYVLLATASTKVSHMEGCFYQHPAIRINNRKPVPICPCLT